MKLIEYHNMLREYGCWVCRAPNPHIHHLRDNTGMGIKANGWDVIPLCGRHHNLGNYGEAIHAGKKKWEELYGTQREIIAQLHKMFEV
jgi:hypothetical protein